MGGVGGDQANHLTKKIQNFSVDQSVIITVGIQCFPPSIFGWKIFFPTFNLSKSNGVETKFKGRKCCITNIQY